MYLIEVIMALFQEVLPSGKESNKRTGPDGGLNVISAAIFVAAEMAGSGVLAIPKAVVDCGKFGVAVEPIL